MFSHLQVAVAAFIVEQNTLLKSNNAYKQQ